MKFWALLLLASTLCACTKKNQDLGSRVVVKVNDIELTAREFADRLTRRLRNFDALSAKDPAILKATKDDLIRDFVVAAISENWAKNNNIFVRKEDLDTELNTLKAHYPDDFSFRRMLAEEHLTVEDWQKKVHSSLLQRKVSDQLSAKISPPTPAEIKDYYEKHKGDFKEPETIRIRQVVLDSENNAKRIQEELDKGKKMAELARKFSITPESKKDGDIGWISRGMLDIFDQGFNMRVGQRSKILKSAYGYHIYEVLDKRRARMLDLKSSEPEIKRSLMLEKEQNLFAGWLESQIKTTRVFKDDTLINAMEVQTRVE